MADPSISHEDIKTLDYTKRKYKDERMKELKIIAVDVLKLKSAEDKLANLLNSGWDIWDVAPLGFFLYYTLVKIDDKENTE